LAQICAILEPKYCQGIDPTLLFFASWGPLVPMVEKFYSDSHHFSVDITKALTGETGIE
jgi:hypothetical protein